MCNCFLFFVQLFIGSSACCLLFCKSYVFYSFFRNVNAKWHQNSTLNATIQVCKWAASIYMAFIILDLVCMPWLSSFCSSIFCLCCLTWTYETLHFFQWLKWPTYHIKCYTTSVCSILTVHRQCSGSDWATVVLRIWTVLHCCSIFSAQKCDDTLGHKEYDAYVLNTWTKESLLWHTWKSTRDAWTISMQCNGHCIWVQHCEGACKQSLVPGLEGDHRSFP